MTFIIHKWEKSFVIVNKGQHTGMVCYCFSVKQREERESLDLKSGSAIYLKDENKKLNAEQYERENTQVQHNPKNDDHSTVEASNNNTSKGEIENLLKDLKNPVQILEETVFDHILTVYKGRYSNTNITARLLQKKLQQSSCKNCAKPILNREEYLEIAKSLLHPFISIPVLTKCNSIAVLTLVHQYRKTVKDIIESRENLRHGVDTDARYICLCLTDAVMYLHDQLILHRDICPRNAYVNDNGEIILGNFEQAIYTSELGVYMYGKCGSLGYQSPEVVAQLGYNHTVDYWGIGCVAYEFLFGIMPYVDADVSRMLSKTVLNPDFAFTRLGGRFNRLPKATQEAFRDGYLNRYPHKRIGFKHYDVKQLRWFQPFRWDMVRNKDYDSPLKKFLTGAEVDDKSTHNLNENTTGSTSYSPKSPRLQQSQIQYTQIKEPVLDKSGFSSDFETQAGNQNENCDLTKRNKIFDKLDPRNYSSREENQQQINALPFINNVFSKKSQLHQKQRSEDPQKQVNYVWQQSQLSGSRSLTPILQHQDEQQTYPKQHHRPLALRQNHHDVPLNYLKHRPLLPTQTYQDNNHNSCNQQKLSTAVQYQDHQQSYLKPHRPLTPVQVPHENKQDGEQQYTSVTSVQNSPDNPQRRPRSLTTAHHQRDSQKQTQLMLFNNKQNNYQNHSKSSQSISSNSFLDYNTCNILNKALSRQSSNTVVADSSCGNELSNTLRQDVGRGEQNPQLTGSQEPQENAENQKFQQFLALWKGRKSAIPFSDMEAPLISNEHIMISNEHTNTISTDSGRVDVDENVSISSESNRSGTDRKHQVTLSCNEGNSELGNH